MTAAGWAGTWSFDTYGDPNLRDHPNGFDHDLFPTIEIRQVDAEHIQIMLPSGGALPLRVSGNTAFLETQPLVVGTIRYHDFRLQGDGNMLVISIPHEPGVPKRFYRLVLDPDPIPPGFALIPAGSFLMGYQSNPLVGDFNELPVHSVYGSAFSRSLSNRMAAWRITNTADFCTAGVAASGRPCPAQAASSRRCASWRFQSATPQDRHFRRFGPSKNPP